MDSVHDVILKYRPIGLMRTLNISYDRVFHIVIRDLVVKILSEMWIRKCRNGDQEGGTLRFPSLKEVSCLLCFLEQRQLSE
jgi:hypothetical protein